MSKLYHSVPLDEEQSLNCLPEKREWTAFNRDTVNRSVGGIQKHWTVIAHAILLSVSLTLFTISFCAKPINPSDPAVLEKFNTYSPIFPAVKYSLRNFSGLGPITKSPYAGYGPEVDKMWDYIANGAGDIMITEEERVKLGLSPDSLKIQDPRTGEWGYRAAVEVFHQLHCLDFLRKVIYKDYYSKPGMSGDIEGAGPEELNGHVDHCIDAIRHNLMCQSDTSVFTFRVFPDLVDQGIEGEWPDMEINHMCRDFDAIKKFNNDRVVSWSHDV